MLGYSPTDEQTTCNVQKTFLRFTPLGAHYNKYGCGYPDDSSWIYTFFFEIVLG